MPTYDVIPDAVGGNQVSYNRSRVYETLRAPTAMYYTTGDVYPLSPVNADRPPMTLPRVKSKPNPGKPDDIGDYLQCEW